MRTGAILWLKKLGLFAAGIFIMAAGVSFSVKSDLGVSPVTSVPFVMSRILGLTLGTSTIIFYIFCMALQAAILRRDYRLKNLFQIAASFAFGFFTDLISRIIVFLPATENSAVRFVYLAVGICCVAFGILLYLSTALIALPTDGTVQAIAVKCKFTLHKVKVGYDCVSTGLALGLSLAFLGELDGLGIGTVVAALGVGRMLGLFTRLLRDKLARFLFVPIHGYHPIRSRVRACKPLKIPAD